MIGHCTCGSETFLKEGKRIYEIYGDEHDSALRYTDLDEPMFRCTDCQVVRTRRELDALLAEQSRAERARQRKRWENKKAKRKAKAR